MKFIFSLIAMAGVMSSAAAHTAEPVDVAGISPITLSNVSPKCVNVTKQSVTVIVTGVNVAKKDTLFKKVKGAGGKTQVQLVSANPGKTYSYPAEAALNVSDIGGVMARAPINLTVLSQYEFDIDGGFREIQIPFYLLKRDGASDIAKYSRALIEFTAKNGSAIPVSGLASAAALVQDLSDAFFSQLDEALSNEVKDPDFRVGYQLSRVDACPSAQFLHSGIFAQIRDTKLKSVGVIRTAEQDDYCFYVIDPNEVSPRIGYIRRTGTCPSTRPDDLEQLNNPQIVYVVIPSGRATARKLAAVAFGNDERLALVGATPQVAAMALLKADPSLPSDELTEMADICSAAGLKAADCF